VSPGVVGVTTGAGAGATLTGGGATTVGVGAGAALTGGAVTGAGVESLAVAPLVSSDDVAVRAAT